MPNRTPLNGLRTHPLTRHAWDALKALARAPAPRQTFNAGVADRLEREDLVEAVDLPSPYATHRGRPLRHLQITAAGRVRLAASTERT
jgi:hypothetical protein